MSVAVLAALTIGSSTASGASGAPVSVHWLSGTVYEYYWVVSTGGDNRIGVHRVVRVRNGKPIAAPNGVFLVHGDTWNFDSAFRGGRSASTSIAVFLASKGIDVWGIDLGWTLVPTGTSDFSFMRGWGLQRDVNDVEKALRFARSVRTRTRSSATKLTLLGWSRGGWIGYALLNEESQVSSQRRQVRAFIPVDTMFKVNNQAIRTTACSFAAGGDSAIASGTYENSQHVVAQLGKSAQGSLLFGAAPFQLSPGITPYYHFVAGTFPQDNYGQRPTGLVYTDASRWSAFLVSARPFEPATLIRDTWAISCSPQGTSRFDNHLKSVTVPMLYIGAGGGFGRAGLYSLTLVGSKDVKSHIVSFRPATQSALDFGHVDLFYARDAQQLVWKPIYPWLSRHAR